jgi:hypothetical protein
MVCLGLFVCWQAKGSKTPRMWGKVENVFIE